MLAPVKSRGALLTAWLVLMLLSNVGTALGYLFGGAFIASIAPTTPVWAIYALGLIALLNTVFTVFLFMWKRWAFYAFCGVAVVVFFINLIAGTGILAALLGLSGPIILYLIMKSRWDLFE